MTYKIGDVARMLRVSTDSLRKWEQHGFIPQPNRRPTNQREYTLTDIKAIKQFLNTKQATIRKEV